MFKLKTIATLLAALLAATTVLATALLLAIALLATSLLFGTCRSARFVRIALCFH
jgi:hypothetical protein